MAEFRITVVSPQLSPIGFHCETELSTAGVHATYPLYFILHTKLQTSVVTAAAHTSWPGICLKPKVNLIVKGYSLLKSGYFTDNYQEE